MCLAREALKIKGFSGSDNNAFSPGASNLGSTVQGEKKRM